MISNRSIKIFEHAADAGAEILATSLERAFGGGVEALLEIMGLDVRFEYGVETGGDSVRVESVGFDQEELLVNFLNDVLYLFTAEFLVPVGCAPVRIAQDKEGFRVFAAFVVQPYRPELHGGARDIKAATFHMTEVRSLPDHTRIKVLFDL